MTKKEKLKLTGRSNFDRMQSSFKNEYIKKGKSEYKKNKKNKTVLDSVEKGNGKKVNRKGDSKHSVGDISDKKYKKNPNKKNKQRNNSFVTENGDFPRGGNYLDFSVTVSSLEHSRAVDMSNKKRSNMEVSGQLFSLQKLKSLQTNDVNEVQDNFDVDHQAFNNEWWGKKKRRRSRKNKNRSNNETMIYQISE